MSNFKIITLIFLLCFILFSFSNAFEGRLMRFPDIYKDRIVFVYAGDLWLVSSEGGIAKRLTTHEGLELFPKFSPDGKMIAFSGQYDGNTDVYVIPSDGGEPKRLTFYPDMKYVPERMGFDDMVLDWFPSERKILFRTWRESFTSWLQRLYSVSLNGGLPEPLILPEGGFASFSPDGDKIAYNRVFRNFRTWKRYRGGLAQEIWIYDLKKNSIQKITDNEWTDTYPMWHKDKIYFASDRDHTMNIFCYDLNAKRIRKITNHKEFDVNWPSLGPNSIIYENGGYLFVLDLTTEKSKKIEVEIPDDRVLARARFVSAKDYITEYSLSPDGKRGLFTSRGDVFTVPAEKGNIRNLTNTSGIREKNSSWSPDGRWVAYISDRTGEDELYITSQDGKGEEIQITFDGNCYRFPPIWSPDSKKLLFADKNLKLYYVEIRSKKITLIDSSLYWEIRNYCWSPDSRWIAYAKSGENLFYSVFLYSLGDKKIYRVTEDFTDDKEPCFDPEGKYLYFFSKRDFNAQMGNFDPSFTYNQMTRIYLVTLQKDTLSPFAPESDETEIKKEEEKKEKNKEKEEKKEVLIDIEGIKERVVAVPITPGNYSGLKAAKGKIFYLSFPNWTLTGREPGPKGSLHLFDLKKREGKKVLAPVDGYELCYDGEKIIYKSREEYGIIDAKAYKFKIGDGELELGGMEVKVDPKVEWGQIFNEVWRLERDFFYAPNMHGLDWEETKRKYNALLPFVSHRYDLTYVLGEMIGELCCSHTYVGGGDRPKPKKIKIGLLGVDWELDKKTGFYKIKKVYSGENWREDYRSPLTEPGVDVKEGEYVIFVDGKVLQYPTNPYSLFENTCDRIVTLKINSKPSFKNSREVEVKPVESEFGLRYLNWVESNRRKVKQKTDARVGYIYFPDMSGEGLNEFVKSFFAQIKKEGLIIDIRYNGGGFVSGMILERLRRVLVGMSSSRNASDYPYPGGVFHGHLVCIANGYSASDGDYFPYYFRQYKLGQIIGQRTWGGAVGIRDFRRLIDNGYITVPEFAPFSLQSEWTMENRGVKPDIEVDNFPDLVIEGKDPQLEKAIEVIMRKIEEEPKKLPQRPPYPIRK